MAMVVGCQSYVYPCVNSGRGGAEAECLIGLEEGIGSDVARCNVAVGNSYAPRCTFDINCVSAVAVNAIICNIKSIDDKSVCAVLAKIYAIISKALNYVVFYVYPRSSAGAIYSYAVVTRVPS